VGLRLRRFDLVKLRLNKKGEVDIDDGQCRGDRYGREIGVVYCDGINVNNGLVENNLTKIGPVNLRVK